MNCLTCERRGLSSQWCFAAREMWSFHKNSWRRDPSACSTLSSRPQCHRAAVTSPRTGVLTFGCLASGWLSWCLPWRQETKFATRRWRFQTTVLTELLSQSRPRRLDEMCRTKRWGSVLLIWPLLTVNNNTLNGIGAKVERIYYF